MTVYTCAYDGLYMCPTYMYNVTRVQVHVHGKCSNYYVTNFSIFTIDSNFVILLFMVCFFVFYDMIAIFGIYKFFVSSLKMFKKTVLVLILL